MIVFRYNISSYRGSQTPYNARYTLPLYDRTPNNHITSYHITMYHIVWIAAAAREVIVLVRCLL
ncbi:hypothetical protein [Bacillus cereus]